MYSSANCIQSQTLTEQSSHMFSSGKIARHDEVEIIHKNWTVLMDGAFKALALTKV